MQSPELKIGCLVEGICLEGSATDEYLYISLLPGFLSPLQGLDENESGVTD